MSTLQILNVTPTYTVILPNGACALVSADVDLISTETGEIITVSASDWDLSNLLDILPIYKNGPYDTSPYRMPD